jgi:hypothetical protein
MCLQATLRRWPARARSEKTKISGGKTNVQWRSAVHRGCALQKQ